MSPEEIIFQFTAIALKELIRNNGEASIMKEQTQKWIGQAAANVAKSAFEQMQTNLGELYE